MALRLRERLLLRGWLCRALLCARVCGHHYCAHSVPDAESYGLPDAEPYGLPDAEPYGLPDSRPHCIPDAEPYGVPYP